MVFYTEEDVHGPAVADGWDADPRPVIAAQVGGFIGVELAPQGEQSRAFQSLRKIIDRPRAEPYGDPQAALQLAHSRRPQVIGGSFLPGRKLW